MFTEERLEFTSLTQYWYKKHGAELENISRAISKVQEILKVNQLIYYSSVIVGWNTFLITSLITVLS